MILELIGLIILAAVCAWAGVDGDAARWRRGIARIWGQCRGLWRAPNSTSSRGRRAMRA